ncbi:hypothetical protein PO124_18035 [Bacillus licheniformis]|nr:hypothetical protein [Bacillus licheniformis]
MASMRRTRSTRRAIFRLMTIIQEMKVQNCTNAKRPCPFEHEREHLHDIEHALAMIEKEHTAAVKYAERTSRMKGCPYFQPQRRAVNIRQPSPFQRSAD